MFRNGDFKVHFHATRASGLGEIYFTQWEKNNKKKKFIDKFTPFVLLIIEHNCNSKLLKTEL